MKEKAALAVIVIVCIAEFAVVFWGMEVPFEPSFEAAGLVLASFEPSVKWIIG